MRKLNIVIAGIMLACIGMSGWGNTQNVSDKTTQPVIEKVQEKEVAVSLKSIENSYKQMNEVFSQKFQNNVLEQINTLK